MFRLLSFGRGRAERRIPQGPTRQSTRQSTRQWALGGRAAHCPHAPTHHARSIMSPAATLPNDTTLDNPRGCIADNLRPPTSLLEAQCNFHIPSSARALKYISSITIIDEIIKRGEREGIVQIFSLPEGHEETPTLTLTVSTTRPQ